MVMAICLWTLQGIVMLVDEFIYHWRRDLPKWERIGHPLDTFCMLLCFDYCLLVPYSSEMQLDIFILLAIISCLIISKDEWVHQERCGGTEHWLHALLFILHPLALLGLYLLWKEGLMWPILIQSCVLLGFMIYQIIYWNFYKRTADETRNK